MFVEPPAVVDVVVEVVEDVDDDVCVVEDARLLEFGFTYEFIEISA